MSYIATTWSNGDTITAAALNKIEQGIAEYHEIYTLLTQEGLSTMTFGELFTAMNNDEGPFFVYITDDVSSGYYLIEEITQSNDVYVISTSYDSFSGNSDDTIYVFGSIK